MNKFKLILIGFSVCLLFGLVATVNIQIKLIKKHKADICRLENNQTEMLKQNAITTDLNVKLSEVNGRLKAQRDSIARALQIKPKEIEKLVYITQYVRDTIDHPVYIIQSAKNHWTLTDSARCYIWKGEAFLHDNNMSIVRTDFTYLNKTTETFYKKKPHKFLFIRYGKTKYLKQVDSDCGQSYITTISFTK